MQKHPNPQALLLVKVVTAQQDHLQPQTFCKLYTQELKYSLVEDGNWEKENRFNSQMFSSLSMKVSFSKEAL